MHASKTVRLLIVVISVLMTYLETLCAASLVLNTNNFMHT